MKVMREYEQTLLDLQHAPGDEAIQEKLLAKQQQMDEYEAWEANTAAKTILTNWGSLTSAGMCGNYRVASGKGWRSPKH